MYISLVFVDGKLLRKLFKCLHERSSILSLSSSEVIEMELLLEALGMSETNLQNMLSLNIEGKPSIFEVAKRKLKVEEELMPVVKIPGAPKKKLRAQKKS